jgi:hypothetical protein
MRLTFRPATGIYEITENGSTNFHVVGTITGSQNQRFTVSCSLSSFDLILGSTAEQWYGSERDSYHRVVDIQRAAPRVCRKDRSFKLG